jgi:signal transduction histidine kinase
MTSFIIDHMEEILAEWEAFAGTMTPAADTMDTAALRDHAKQMLEAIARDIQTVQSGEEQDLKSRGLAPDSGRGSAAAAHGALRQQVGFDLGQLVAEFRALRASVLRIWLARKGYADAPSAYEMARFNEAIDQALGESVTTYSAELAKSRDTFLGILGHDLRAPLAALWGAVEVLASARGGSSHANAHAAANRSLGAMSGMIRDLLEYTRTRLGKGIPVKRATADFESLCRACVVEMSLAYPNAAFRFTSEGGAAAGEFDRERMHQVVSNLLGNAVQHAATGTAIAVASGHDSACLWLSVTNQGQIIAPEHLQTIFDPLVQLAPGDSTPSRSTNLGLGLFIAREIVIAHGGSIDASSSADLGTTFTIRVPRAAASMPASQAAGVPAR